MVSSAIAGSEANSPVAPAVDVYGTSGDDAVECFSRGRGSFSLVAEPWVPVLTTSGMQVRNLVRAFDADVIAVATGDDLEDTALVRLLLAIHIAATHAGLTPQHWVDAHRGRFDLFHPERPFWQNPDMARFAQMPGAVQPLVSASYRHAGRGSTAVNVWHNESGLIFDAAAAARLLVVRQQFSAGGRQPLTTAAYGAAPVSAMASVAANRPFLWLDDGRLASSLAATASLAGAHPPGKFWFTWPEDASPAHIGTPTGVLDGLTWQSRSLLLIRGEAGTVPGVMMCDGLRWPQASSDDDVAEQALIPHTVYVREPSGQYTPQRVHPDRPAWHQLAVMCTDAEYPCRVTLPVVADAVSHPRWRLGGLACYKAAILGAIVGDFPVPVDASQLRVVLEHATRAYFHIGAVTAALAEAVSEFAGYRAAIPSHTGLSAEFEQVAAAVARGEFSSSQGVELVHAIAESTVERAYLSVSRVRPMVAARVAARMPPFTSTPMRTP